MQSAPLVYNFISLLGIGIICGLAWLSAGKVRARPKAKLLIWGLAMQLVMAALIFALPTGRAFLLTVNTLVASLLNSAQAGIRFLFGPLGIMPGQTGAGGQKSLGFILALHSLPTMVFFMSLTALAYQAGIMQRVVRFFARVFSRALGTSGAESLGAASSIFVGVETAGSIRPYLENLTRSEFFLLLVAGMSTVASTVLGAYATILHAEFPNIAGHLVSASLISAPAAIVVAKLMEPESETPATLGVEIDLEAGKKDGYMEAAISGSMEGMKLLVGVAALLLSFVSLAALVDALLGWLGGLAGWPQLSLKGILAYPAWPLALAMGVPPADAWTVAKLLGERIILTEFVAYVDMAGIIKSGGFVYARSAVVASYALCGFAHIASLAIFVGGYGALVPSRMGFISKLGPKALWAATLTTLLTGCIAGLFATGGKTLLGIGG